MKSVVKSILIGSALVAGAANATVTAPSNGASDLILFVTGSNGTSNNAFYVFDTGVSLDTVLAKTSVVAGTTLDTTTLTYNTAFNVGPNLSSFLTANSADTFTWSVMAADPTGFGGIGNAPYAVGNLRFLFSSSAFAPVGTTGLSNTNLKTSLNSAAGWVAFANSINAATYTADASTSVGFGDAAAGKNANVGFSLGPTIGSALGTAQSLWTVASSTASTAGVPAGYKSVATFTLSSAGVLTVSNGTGPAVPVPGAVWLLGSGLLGLVGVSRRRAA